MEAFEPLIEHVQENMGAYIGGGVAALVAIAVFRRVAIPFVSKLVELAIYFSTMHVVVGAFVRVVNWFKGATTMQGSRVKSDMESAPGWETPWVAFWDRSAYVPSWLVYVEIGFCVVIVGIVWHFRPLFIKPKVDEKPKEVSDTKKKYQLGGDLAPKSTPSKRGKKGKGKKK